MSIERYLRDIVYGANDGIITTFAIICGVYGAGLDNFVILALGFSNLIADGISMAASSYLGYKSAFDIEQKLKQQGTIVGKPTEAPMQSSFVTFLAFVITGFLPLTPFFLSLGNVKFILSIILTFVTLFTVGSLRSIFTKKFWFFSGLEMLFIGGFAALTAYLIGYLIKILYNL